MNIRCLVERDFDFALSQTSREGQTGLVEALTGAMKVGGLPTAIHLCRDEAQTITAGVAQKKGIDVVDSETHDMLIIGL